MDERDTLAALLDECAEFDAQRPEDLDYAATAARLLAAGVRVAPSPDAPGLREALALAEVIPLSHDLEQAVGQAEVVITALRAALAAQSKEPTDG